MTVAANSTRMTFYTTAQIGPKMARTKEGYLVCYEVPIARTGSMLYMAGEIPITPAPGDPIITVYRNAEQLFNVDALASGNGKPIVNEHPSAKEVTPATYASLAKGSMFNLRRGTDDLSEFMVCDFMITDPYVADLVESRKKREVSLGYNANYVEMEPGTGYQEEIIINHVALVKSGRCGAQCAIGDHSTVNNHTCKCNGRRNKAMKATKWLDSLLTAVRSNDEKEVKRLATLRISNGVTNDGDGDEDEPVGAGAVHIHVGDKEGEKGNAKWNDEAIDKYMEEHGKEHAALKTTNDELSAKCAGLEAAMGQKADKADEAASTTDEDISADPSMDSAEKVADAAAEEAPEGEEDKARKTNDSSVLVRSYQEVRAMAEIIAPGISVPTVDAKAKRVTTLDSFCDLRRRALGVALANDKGSVTIKQVRGKALTADTLGKLDCRSVRTLFQGVGAAMAHANRTATADSVPTGQGFGEGVGTKPPSNKELNAKFKDFYKDKL